MPKVYEQNKAAGKRPVVEPKGPAARPAGLQSLKEVGYYEGVAALGMDPQQVGPDLQMLGLDQKTLTEDMSTILQEFQPCYDYYLRAEEASKAVATAYASPGGAKSAADGQFNITLLELVGKTIDICKTAEFTKSASLGARKALPKAELREKAAQAQKLLDELQKLVATLALMAARVSASPASSLNMQIGMDRIVEIRALVQWQQSTFRREGFEIGDSKAETPKPAAPAE